MTEYAFEGFVYGQKQIWSDSYGRLGDARRAAKEWVNKTPSRTAVLLQKQPRPAGHEFGVEWAHAGQIKWTT